MQDEKEIKVFPVTLRGRIRADFYFLPNTAILLKPSKIQMYAVLNYKTHSALESMSRAQ